MAFFDDIIDDSKANQSSKGTTENMAENKKQSDMPPHQDVDLGEAPDFPAITFTYDYKTNKLQVRDRRGNIKAEFTVMPVNGASAYDLWKENHKNEKDTTYEAYIKDITGKNGSNGKNGKNAYEEWKEWQGANVDVSPEAYWEYFKGKNGKSAFELWQDVHGEKSNSTPDDFFEYLKGKDGKDAYEVWQELGYKNRSRQDFFKWLASLVETQKGEDGKIYYPHFDGYTLYFTDEFEGNGTRLIEKDIRGKDGRTFEPKFEGSKLHFDDGEGTITPSVDLKGKDAFELWKEYHHKPDAKYEDFEEYFKGQNVQAKHSYHDIKDFTCPVQTIDTNLIANILDSNTSPDDLVNLRQEDIDKLRKAGNKRSDWKIKGCNVPYFFLNGSLIYENWAGWFKEFSWWCAGADRGLLRMCPGDHSKYTGIGTVILFTALMAWLSSFYAMEFVFQNHVISICFATFWALLIFFLDRFITNTMYSDGKVSISKEELIGGLPRILIAIFLGIVISAPLELRIFNTEIREYIVSNKLEDNQEYVAACSQFDERIDKIAQDLNDYYIRHLPDRNDPVYKSKYSGRDSTVITKGVKTVTDTKTDSLGKIISSSTNIIPIDVIEKVKIFVFNQEVFNNACQTFDKNYAEQEKTAYDQLKELARNLELQKTEIKTRLYSDYDSSKTSGLYERLSALHAIAMQIGTPYGYKPLFLESSGQERNTRTQESIENKILKRLSTDSLDQAVLKEDIKRATLNVKQNSQDNKVNLFSADIIAKVVFSILSIILLLCLMSVKISRSRENLIKIILAIILGIVLGCCYELFHYIFYYFTSAVGLIMLLFILIDISPVLYKMMLADGVYDNYLHQEKLLAQDKIRLSLARMLRNIEKSELKSLSPFIMGKIYRKLKKFSISKDEENKEKDYKQHIKWEKNGDAENFNQEIKNANKSVFETVLDYKKRIILASYSAWYRDMRDAMIGKKDDEEGQKIKPEVHLQADKEPKYSDVTGESESENTVHQNEKANASSGTDTTTENSSNEE